VEANTAPRLPREGVGSYLHTALWPPPQTSRYSMVIVVVLHSLSYQHCCYCYTPRRVLDSAAVCRVLRLFPNIVCEFVIVRVVCFCERGGGGGVLCTVNGRIERLISTEQEV
jgi:hypothetical protein